MDYSAHLDGNEICCLITADRDITAPVFCFSGMAPMTAVAGGNRLAGIGSFTEVSLPDLIAGIPHRVTLAYIQGHRPANRAWLPMGPYLRSAGQIIPLPFTPAGCRPQKLPNTPAFEGLPLVPQPTHWRAGKGMSGCTGFRGDDPSVATVTALAARQGKRFAGETDVQFVNRDVPDEGYVLTIDDHAVSVAAGDAAGRFYACVTLLNLLQDGPLPCGEIEDCPRFSWRGQHLDTARHFYKPKTILDLLDTMALLKLNRFHWHFSDDEAFRLELDSLPDLWQRTRLCGEGHLLPALFAGGVEAGGSYSKAEAREIIAHAAALHIDVMPEIEAPAHGLALTHVYPETRDPADNGSEVSVQGYLGNTLNPAMPKTWLVLEKMVSEIADLFPFKHMHLGCDELAVGAWMGSPKARALMDAEGLSTGEDLQGWMMRRLGQIAVDHGQRPAAWEEAAKGGNGGVGHNAILFSWTGQGPGLAAAAKGYDVVMCPAQHVYLDMAHTDDPDDWGASWAAFVSLEDTVRWEPVPDPALSDRIIGVQGTFWSEFTTEDAQIWPMLLPRMLGVAAMAWQQIPPSPTLICQLAKENHLCPRGAPP